MSQFVVITGLSGAGRSEAARHLEDLGWFSIDNVPAALIPKLGELVAAPTSTHERIALVIRTGDYDDDIRPALDALRASSVQVRILFLEASTATLVRRYGGTRRRHPLAGDGTRLADAIERERQILEPVKAEADVVVDTSTLNVHELRDRIVDLFADASPAGGLQTSVVSFGYKHGLPLDVDLVFDCRFLPNPHWVDELRPLTGRDQPVRDYVLAEPEAAEFLERLDGLLGLVLPAYANEGKSYLTIALGCTGGRHRSVAVADEVAGLLRRHGFDPAVKHRDIDR